MDLTTAKQQLRDSYTSAGLTLTDEHEKELFFQAIHGYGTIRVSEEEIERYAYFEGRRSQYKAEPTECSMISTTYREHALSPPDTRRYAMLFRDLEMTFGAVGSTQPYVQIDSASDDFVDFVRFHEAYLPFSVTRMRRPIRSERSEMRELLYKPLTIKVFNIGETSVSAALRKSDSIIDTALFEAAYLKGYTFELQTEWPRREHQTAPFRFAEPLEGLSLPLSRAAYSPDLVRFYLRGCSANDPAMKYLAFYQVLEYFFLTASDEHLYARLSARLHDPLFSATPPHLDKLIQDTLDHRRQTDETEMLKLVLQKHVDEREAVSFIEAYEAHLKVQLFTKKRSIFGEESQVNTQPSHVFGGLARRIKVIRNALVHSSDRHERNERFVPTPANEQVIEKEVPLVKFLAERVVISTAKSEIYR